MWNVKLLKTKTVIYGKEIGSQNYRPIFILSLISRDGTKSYSGPNSSVYDKNMNCFMYAIFDLELITQRSHNCLS